MDNDTSFPALSDSEIIVGKYEGHERSQLNKAIVIVTNFRLLIRWKATICGCFNRSSYSSIILDSIDRIDETRLEENLTFLSISILLVGIISCICGFIYETQWLRPLGITFIVFSMVLVVCLWNSNKKRYITLKGTFGLETVMFKTAIAREFAGQLTKMIHQRRTQYFVEQNAHNRSYSPREFSTPLGTVDVTGTDVKVENENIYDPLLNMA
ncbi:unnamed protein product [Adineta ricciae]|uniref:Uncharacterized protein n=1 Tax=Adineta ricciae TaxID=249248 RepID=A0A815MAC5_ADIRI|nr:unnamed protein product [Adineta ricciae]CAF1423488.1 unnamed protein product [Adineta ricciae]